MYTNKAELKSNSWFANEMMKFLMKAITERAKKIRAAHKDQRALISPIPPPFSLWFLRQLLDDWYPFIPIPVPRVPSPNYRRLCEPGYFESDEEPG